MTGDAVPLVVRRMIGAPRATVFAAFTRADLLAQWFTPDADVSLEVLKFAFEPNGSFRLRYDMPDGRRPVVGGVFQLIDPPAEIVLSWIWEAPDPLEGIAMRVRFTFADNDDATEVVVTHEGLPSDAACTIHEDGWAAALDSLERFMMPPSPNTRERR